MDRFAWSHIAKVLHFSTCEPPQGNSKWYHTTVWMHLSSIAQKHKPWNSIYYYICFMLLLFYRSWCWQASCACISTIGEVGVQFFCCYYTYKMWLQKALRHNYTKSDKGSKQEMIIWCDLPGLHHFVALYSRASLLRFWRGGNKNALSGKTH